MKEIEIRQLLQIMPCFTAALVLALFWYLGRQGNVEKVVFRAYSEIRGLLKKQNFSVSWYEKRAQWLTRNGAAFHFGKKMNPIYFLSLQIILGAVGFGAASSISIFVGSVTAILLWLLPNVGVIYFNHRDNEELLPEMKLVYHALEIQIRAGVYVTDALTECFGSIQNKRLRSALLELAGDLVMKADVGQALEHFQEKFDNRYVDSLCLIVLQALESGQAVDLLADIGGQLKDMEESVLERKKAALDRSVTFYQLGILAAVLGMSLYACVVHMMEKVVQF